MKGILVTDQTSGQINGLSDRMKRCAALIGLFLAAHSPLLTKIYPLGFESRNVRLLTSVDAGSSVDFTARFGSATRFRGYINHLAFEYHART